VESKGAVACDSNSFLMNECDEYALEAALLWKKERRAEVTAATLGASAPRTLSTWPWPRARTGRCASTPT